MATCVRSSSALQTWHSLGAVQSLFAADLPWYHSNLNKPGLSDASRASIENLRVFFKFDIRQISIILQPDSGLAHLTEEDSQRLEEELAKILLVLESKIDERVLNLYKEHVKSRGHQGGNWATAFKDMISLIPRYFYTAGTGDAEPTTVYPKLCALRALLDNLGEGSDPVYEYGNCIKLGDTLDEFKRSSKDVERFTLFLSSMVDIEPAGPSTHRTLSRSCLRAGAQQAQEVSHHLFGALAQLSVECHQPHQGMLHLTGFGHKETGPFRPVYDMFMSCCPISPHWYEAHCVVSDPTDHPTVMDIKSLCSIIRRCQQTQEPLRLILGGNNLFHSPGEPGCFEYPEFKHIVSLKTLLEKGRFQSAFDGGLFTPRSKMLLVVNLARCLMCLFGSRWLQYDWKTSDIVFLGNSEGDNLVDMHRPYIKATFSFTYPILEEIKNEISPPHHPAILSFAKILIEIQQGRLITQDQCQFSKGLHSQWLTISKILSRELSAFATGDYISAVKACLDFARPSGYGSGPGNQVQYIYDKILVPLENDLARYQQAQLDNVKFEMILPNFYDATTTAMEPNPPWEPRSYDVSNTAVGLEPETSQGIDKSSLHSSLIVFDDNVDDGLTSKTNQARALEFFELLDRWLKTRHHESLELLKKNFNSNVIQAPTVKIAILDTGICRNHPSITGATLRAKRDFSRRDNPIKECKDFVGDNGVDDCGHGTLTTSLLLQTAPKADIYVARVASGKTTGRCTHIAEALNEAVKQWSADIIVMPFGVNGDKALVEQAINNAYHRGTILIASAANDGANSGRAYPARDERVICIHAIDGKGNDYGGINPTSVPSTDNFATLGLGIKFFWSGQDVYKSGTSYAAPIAAGIAANILDFIRHPAFHDRLNDEQKRLVGTTEGIRRIFRLMCGPTRQSYDYIAPWTLWREGLDESDVLSNIKAKLL